jgi:RNA polymerase sigma-70 factor (ECF subfamily)
MNSCALSNAEQLLSEAREGNRESLGALLEQYRAYLHLLARMQLGWRGRVAVNPSDLVQEAFLQASVHFADFAGRSEPEWRGWLRTILHRRLLRQVRKQSVPGKCGLPRELPLEAQPTGSGGCGSGPGEELISPGSSPSGPVRRRELTEFMARRLARLPAPYREVLVLRNLEGLPFAEVARRMGRSPGAARMLWLRALEQLRQQRFSEDLL